MRLLFFIVLSSVFIQNIYAVKDYLSWKDVKSQYKWSTANVLWCRYKMPSGRMFENAGRTAQNKLVTYAYSPSENYYFWSCPDAYDPLRNRHSCPHFITNGRYNYSDSWFVVNDQNNHKQLRPEFILDAQKSCLEYTPHYGFEFVEYGVKSTSDFLQTLFHKPFFSRVPDLGKQLPFSRVVVFGDSLTDSGNSFDTLNYPEWPYFLGRFSNGPIWVEYMTHSLIQNEKSQFDLYNYATGGGGVTNPSYNPFGIFYKQVENYLDIMKEGEQSKILDPGYDSTLFVIFIGSNDYTLPTKNNGLLEKLLYCSVNSPKKCAKNVVNGIQMEIEKILKSTNFKAKYFLIPTQPDLTLSPYYQKITGQDGLIEKKFIHAAIVAHNTYMNKMLTTLEGKYPHIKILRLPAADMIADMVQNADSHFVLESGITNTKDACFTGSAKNIKNQTFCVDPASYMFWDGYHLTTTTNCIFGEFAVSKIYEFFGGGIVYQPQYAHCHLNDITHETP